MSNIIIRPWNETPGDRSLRQLGHKTTEHGILETGITVCASELRKASAPIFLAKIARALQKITDQMADLRWDDEKVCLTIGIQVRNHWEQGPDGEWHEEGDQRWLDKVAKDAKKK